MGDYYICKTTIIDNSRRSYSTIHKAKSSFDAIQQVAEVIELKMGFDELIIRVSRVDSLLGITNVQRL